jgi:hypothetical protein
MMKISKKVMKEIYGLSSIIDGIGGVFLNDRNPNRARDIMNLVEEGRKKCQTLINSQPPL